MGQTDVVMADIQDFRSAAGLSADTPTVYLIPGSADPGIRYSSDLPEADLDLEWAGAIAKDASIVYVNSSDVLSSLQYAIQNQVNGITIPVLSISYGDCEPNFSSTEIATYEAAFQQANAQGQTIVSAAGDSGAADCDYSYGNVVVTSATHGLQVDYPASSQYVTSVGGTEFSEGSATGSTQYWNANGGNDVISSAISYIPEMAWNDTPDSATASSYGGFYAGGGGKSLLFGKPGWQTGVPGIPADSARDLPDISLAGSPNHDGYLACTQIALTNGSYTSSCTNGFRYSDSTLEVFGGTSVAAPAFASVLALIEQHLGAKQGNINPALYSIASNSSTYASAFHDVTIGSNAVPCTQGSLNCQSNGVLGYSAGTGYDQATGLGSIDSFNLSQSFGSIATKATATANLSFSPSSPTVGQTVTITGTITGISGDPAPTGTVSFVVDGTTVANAVALSNGVASTTYAFSTGGSHAISLSYSGDSTYNAANASATLNVGTTAGAAPTTTSVSANPTTIALGSSLTLTATVTSTTSGTISGTVSFAVGNTTLGTANVVAGASGTGTASLTISALASSGFIAGTDTITATYSGSSAYAQSSGNTSISVNNPSFTITVANMTIPSASPGANGNSTITLTSSGGYAGTVNLTSTTTDTTLNANYTINPASVTLTSGGTGTATITISTVSGSAIEGPASHFRKSTARLATGGGVALAGVLLFSFGNLRRRRWPALLALLVFVTIAAGVGCSSSTSAVGASAPGTYTLTVTGTDSANGSITSSATFTLTIQ